jgi:hypothetical protein
MSRYGTTGYEISNMHINDLFVDVKQGPGINFVRITQNKIKMSYAIFALGR